MTQTINLNKIQIYNSEVITPYGTFNFAVEEACLDYAKSSIRSAIDAEMKAHPALIKISKVWKSNRRIVNGMKQVKGTNWAWVKKV